MRKVFLPFLVLSALFLVVSSSSFAATKRYATCDACGFCPTVVNGSNPSCTAGTPPGDWKSCVKCLYPTKFPAESTPDPTNCDTLLVDDATNLPVYPVAVGRQFTLLGCIKTDAGVGFSSQQGAPSFVQAMLNVVFSLAGGAALLYLMYGGFIVLTSRADPERLNYGKRLIYGAVIGLLFTLGSVFLVNLIGSGILHIPGMTGASTP